MSCRPHSLDGESMCHRGDTDEGWCHHDLSAVLSAGSLDPIRIHQLSCSVTFLVRHKSSCSRWTAAEKHDLFERWKWEENIFQVFLKPHLHFTEINVTVLLRKLNRTFCFYSSHQEEKWAVNLVIKSVQLPLKVTPLLLFTSSNKTTRCLILLQLIKERKHFYISRKLNHSADRLLTFALK